VIGQLTASALVRVLQNFLSGVGTSDPLIFGGIALLLTGVTLAACAIPARRASKVDPIRALRHE
jgi:ABC-type antimicrobial peptide transport system permease subunit